MRAAVLVVGSSLLAASSLSGQEMMPGTARPLIENLPSTTSGFICPMHPNEVKTTPGTCSICGMTLVPGDPMATADYALTLSTEPRAVKAGQKTKFRIAVRHPLTGEPVTAVRRGPRSPLPLLHRQPRHDAVLPRASDAREGRLVHARTRPSGRRVSTCCSATSCRSAADRS